MENTISRPLAESDSSLENNQKLEQLLKESEAGRAARLEISHELQSLLKEGEENQANQSLALEQTRSALETLKKSKMVRM